MLKLRMIIDFACNSSCSEYYYYAVSINYGTDHQVNKNNALLNVLMALNDYLIIGNRSMFYE